MTEFDKRNRFAEEVFTFRSSKDGVVFISWHGKQVTTLRGKAAERFLEKIANLEGREAQLVMAKVTGHFKHGNER